MADSLQVECFWITDYEDYCLYFCDATTPSDHLDVSKVIHKTI